MKKCIIIDTSYPINGRNTKFLTMMRMHYPDSVFKVVTWNRRMEKTEFPEEYIVYQKGSELGNRIKKFFNIFGYKSFVKDVINQEQPDVIIASHWDSLFVVPSKNRKKHFVIYDNIDVPEGNVILRSLERIMEKVSIYKADLIIHASRFFKEIYSNYRINQIVIENKPIFEKVTRTDMLSCPIKISYIGNIRYVETLMPLVNAVEHDKRFQLDFYGGGPDLEKMKRYSSDRIVFHGRYDYNDVASFYLSSDLIWAAYPNKDFNVKYAISNKFHESMCLDTPSIFANETKLGDFVEANKLGFVVNPYNIEDVKRLLNNIASNPEIIAEVRNSIHGYLKTETTWEQDMNVLYKFIE